MAALTICSDFGAQEKNKICHYFHFFPSICHEVMGSDTMILVFWMLSFKPAFTLSFTLIKRLFSSSCSLVWLGKKKWHWKMNSLLTQVGRFWYTTKESRGQLLTAPERIKQLGQSRNDAQLWICLVVKVWRCKFSSVQFSSVAQLCPTLCDPMNCSTSVLPVHHQVLEFTQTHVHWVSDAIQPSYPLSSPSPAPNTSK